MLKIRRKRALFVSRSTSKLSRRKRRIFLPLGATLLLLLVGITIAGGMAHKTQRPMADTAPPSATTKSPATPPQAKPQAVSDIFNGYGKNLYDKTTNTYSFSSSDYSSLFKGTSLTDDGSGLKSGTINTNGQTWNIYCYSSLNSCSVSTSSGTYGNVSCYNTTNSCSYSDTNGNYANTSCYTYTNSCSTTGSNGYSSNTQCYQYTNSCSTTDSNGGYSNTYCYQYTNSCTTNNSNGSSTNTYCYQYTSSCSSSTYGGTSTYDSYGN